MAYITVSIKVEVPESFKPCENGRQACDQYECPFSYYNYDYGCETCDYDYRDCPMQIMRAE